MMLIYSITEQRKNCSTNQQIACALPAPWGAAAVPSYRGSLGGAGTSTQLPASRTTVNQPADLNNYWQILIKLLNGAQ